MEKEKNKSKLGQDHDHLQGFKCHTNPSSDKIMIICKVLDISPEWLLSGVDSKRTGKKKQGADWYVVDKKSELGFFIEQYNFCRIPQMGDVFFYAFLYDK